MIKLSLFLGFVLILAGCKPANAPGDPGARLQAFLAALAKGNITDIRKFVVDARPSKDVDDLFAKNPPATITAKITDVSISGTEARVKFDETAQGTVYPGQVAFFRYKAGDWYLDRNPDEIGKRADWINGEVSIIQNAPGP